MHKANNERRITTYILRRDTVPGNKLNVAASLVRRRPTLVPAEKFGDGLEKAVVAKSLLLRPTYNHDKDAALPLPSYVGRRRALPKP